MVSDQIITVAPGHKVLEEFDEEEECNEDYDEESFITVEVWHYFYT